MTTSQDIAALEALSDTLPQNGYAADLCRRAADKLRRIEGALDVATRPVDLQKVVNRIEEILG
jgi:hypothetical protein